jgi:hypothetical protein
MRESLLEPNQLVPGWQPAADAAKPAPLKSNLKQGVPAKSTVDKHNTQPVSVSSSLSGFARFAKVAMDRRKQPGSNLAADLDTGSWPDPPQITEKVRSPEPGRNTVHIGRVDIQIAPPAEPPLPSSPRTSRPTTILSRGFLSRYGLKQG